MIEEVPLEDHVIDMKGDPLKISSAQIIGDHTEGSFSLYQIQVKADKMQWTILRRYSWFKAVYDQLVIEDIALTCEFPPITWWGKLDEVVVALRKVQLEIFLKTLVENPVIMQKPYVASFFLPVRCLTTFIETSLNITAIKSKTVFFIDPMKDGDTYDPQIEGILVDYDQLTTWEVLEMNQLQPFEEESEILEIRAQIHILKERKRREPYQEEFLKACSRRLLHLTNLKKQRLQKQLQ
eukprot:TRINITY_DN780_c0_g1_i1.p1 TRINITY_DN780_c0_g1~~TRINITY_DN780_c0_g1_i1.p1  ORF type:complete len:238 (-),score=48.57 TRINITY_DN780_c0_g1_i1:18-731(-)